MASKNSPPRASVFGSLGSLPGRQKRIEYRMLNLLRQELEMSGMIVK